MIRKKNGIQCPFSILCTLFYYNSNFILISLIVSYLYMVNNHGNITHPYLTPCTYVGLYVKKSKLRYKELRQPIKGRGRKTKPVPIKIMHWRSSDQTNLATTVELENRDTLTLERIWIPTFYKREAGAKSLCVLISMIQKQSAIRE